MAPLTLFSIQFTFLLVAYALAARWYVAPKLAKLSLGAALIPLLWIHVFRMIGGSLLAPGSVAAGVPMAFRELVGYGDMITAVLALIAIVALRREAKAGVALAWICVTFGALDTLDAIVQSMRYSVFDRPLGLNWVVVTAYVPALVVSTVMIYALLLRSRRSGSGAQ